MRIFVTTGLLIVLLGNVQANVFFDPNSLLSQQQRDEWAVLFEIFLSVYDNNPALIPDEPNEILALQFSEDSTDQLAWAIFRLIQEVIDPNLTALNENTFLAMDKQYIDTDILKNSTELSEETTASHSVMTASEQVLPQSEDPIIAGLPILKELSGPQPVLIKSPAISTYPPRGESEPFAGWPQPMSTQNKALDSQPSIIEINSDITTNQVWDANNVYYITDANGIDIQALLVIEPGTTVIMGYCCGLLVNNGGTLIAKGTSDKPIIFTPDYMYFYYHEHLGHYWELMPNYGPLYDCSMYIEDTASPATTVQYCLIEGAVGGIVTDNIRLVEPIENNYLFGNVWGIYEFGPKLTDIRNNLCYYNNYAGIEVYLLPDPNKIPDTENPITIEQNTCDDYQLCGMTIHGVPDPNNVPTVYLFNNIVSESYWCGLSLVDGYMKIVAVSTGYYGNYYDKNWDFDEFSPVCTDELPFYPYPLEEPYQILYLNSDSAFIDAGLKYIEQTKWIGTTTNINGSPDKGLIDLGFHHIDWGYVGGEGIIAGSDLDDLIEISEYWLKYSPFDSNSPCYIDPNLYIYDPNHPENWIDPNFVSFGGDWNDDSYVDLADFAIMAQTWNKTPIIPDLQPVIIGNLNNSPIGISVTGNMSNTMHIFAFISGHYIGEIFNFERGVPIEVDISDFGNKSQQLKFVAIDSGGYITWSGPTDIVCTSPLGYCALPQNYEPNEPIPFAAYNTDPNATIGVYGDGGQLIWSQLFNGNSIHGVIPAGVIANHTTDCVQFASSSGATTSKVINPAIPALSLPDPNIMAMLVLPNTVLNLGDYRTIKAVREAFENRGIKYIELRCKNATYANLARYAPQLKYLYIDAHGAWSVNAANTGVPRTSVVLADGDCVSAKASDFVGTPPSWCKDPLPGNLEQTAHSFVTMGFTDLRFFYNDSCLGGHLTIGASHGTLVEEWPGEQNLFDTIPHNDMSLAVGMDNTSESRFYQAWFNESESGLPWAWSITWLPIIEDETQYQRFSRNEWEALGNGEGLYWAVWLAVSQQDYFGPDDPSYNYRIKGQGDIINLRIHSNP